MKDVRQLCIFVPQAKVSLLLTVVKQSLKLKTSNSEHLNSTKTNLHRSTNQYDTLHSQDQMDNKNEYDDGKTVNGLPNRSQLAFYSTLDICGLPIRN